MWTLLLLLLAAPDARASEIVLGAAGGRDFATDQFWTGINFAWLPDKEDKWGGMVRVTPAWGFSDVFPFLALEAGAVRALPHDGEIVRLGLLASTMVVATEYRLPVEFADSNRHWGLIPAVEALVEFEFFEERPFIFGVRAGISSTSTNYLCDEPDQVEDCLAWFPGFTGGFYARGAVVKRLYLDGLIGPSPRLSVSYVF